MKRIIGILVSLLVLAGLALAIWWQVLSSGQKAAIEAWFAQRRAAGWQAELSDVTVSGFPFELDRRLTGIQLADPKAGWSWTLPEVQVNGTATSPTRMMLILPDRHRIAVPGERIDISHRRFDAEVYLLPGPWLDWQEGHVHGEDLKLVSQSGWSAAADAISAALVEREPGTAPPNSYSLTLDASKVTLPRELLAQIDPTGLLSTSVEEVSIAAAGAFRAPLDRRALEEGQLALVAGTIRHARLSWGELTVDARGGFEVDAQGYPEGKINLTLGNWRQMITIARGMDALDKALIDAAEQALEFVALLAGNGDDLDVPLSLSGGKVRIGPIAIADAPRLAPPQ
ncbi:DUF2125 domain-containing protein [Rhodobacteraceae bacterium NNCM2]|nr:DUF2125 domain-containing protein [Coraliihabitans acroporae]